MLRLAVILVYCMYGFCISLVGAWALFIFFPFPSTFHAAFGFAYKISSIAGKSGFPRQVLAWFDLVLLDVSTFSLAISTLQGIISGVLSLNAALSASFLPYFNCSWCFLIVFMLM
jgi:hypothetical protein